MEILYCWPNQPLAVVSLGGRIQPSDEVVSVAQRQSYREGYRCKPLAAVLTATEG